MNGVGYNAVDVWGRVTNTNPSRPENEPDKWEYDALQAIKNKDKQIVTLGMDRGEPIMRVIRPLEKKPSCLQCHRDQAYNAGDNLGGMSVSVPLKNFDRQGRAKTPSTALVHGIIWAVGTTSGLVAGRRLKWRIIDRVVAEASLQKSETRFRQAMDAADECLWEWDIPTDHVYRSPHYYTMMGYSVEELSEHRATGIKLIHPEDRDFAVQAFAQLADGQAESFTADYRMHAKDGRWLWIRSQGKVVERDGEGRPLRAVGTHIDITERKLAEDALRAIVEGTSSAVGAEFFRNLVQRLATALDIHYAFVAEMTDATNTTANTLAFWAGDKWADNFEYDIRGTPCENASQSSLCSYARNVQRLFPDDHLLTRMDVESYVGMPLRDASGEVVGVMAIMDTHPLERQELAASMLQVFSTRAATEIARQKAERQRERLEGQLRHAQKMEAIGTLATGIAHDFNNLLTAISGYTDLAKGQLDAGHPSYKALEIVDQAIRDASGIADSLLTFSHKSRTNKAPIRICKVVQDSIKLLSHLVPASIQIREDYGDYESLHVFGEAGQLHQVMMNLVNNARDAMPKGGTISIKVLAETPEQAAAAGLTGESPGILLLVEDTGVGMTNDVVSKIFDPFFTTKSRGQGTGLGLAMVHGVIQDHRGRIDVHSEPGKGTRVAIRIPQCDAPVSAHEPMQVRDSIKHKPRTVMLVEDHEIARSIIARAFKSSDFTVIEVSRGNEVMDRLLESRAAIDLIILDVDLPGKSGLKCREEIRKDFPTMPILLITGSPEVIWNDGEDRLTTLLRKPFKMPEIVDMANSLIGKSA